MPVQDTDMFYRGSRELARIYRGDHILVWEPVPPHDYSGDYLTLEVLTGGTFVSSYNWEYSVNDGEWESPYTSPDWQLSGDYYSRVFVAGDLIRMKATGIIGGRLMKNDYLQVPCGMVCNVYGNLLSLVYGDNFSGQTSLGSSKFEQLFYVDDPAYSLYILNSGNLVIPATTSDTGNTHTFDAMFANQSRLVYPPKELPLLQLTDYCYYGMFRNCTSMVRIPKILATQFTTGSGWSMAEMFAGCTSLTSATIYQRSVGFQYTMWNLFDRCSSLTEVTMYLQSRPSLANNISGIFSNVAQTGTLYVPYLSTWWTSTGEVPSGWTVVQKYLP